MKATLINPQGQKVVVESGSPDAQNYFGQGYTLMGANVPAVPAQLNVSEMLGQTSGKLNEAINSSQMPTFTDFTPQLNEIYGNITKQLDSINQAAQPTSEMASIGNEIAGKQTQITNLDSGFQQGMNKIEDQAIPMPFITGQQASVQRNYNQQRGTLVAEESNLLNRLGLAREAQKANLEAQKFGLSSLFDVAGLQMKAQDAINSQKQQVWQNAQTLTQNAQNTLATILEKFQGIDPDKLTAQATAQLTQLAQQAGIDPQLLFAGMRTVKDQQDFENSLNLMKASGAGTDMNELLSPTEAAAMGVPYGTTKAQAIEQGIIPKLDQQTQARVDKVANQFDGEQLVKNFTVTQEGYQFAKSLSDTSTSSADDIGLIYAFAKSMDPNSVVREGEYATVQKYAQAWMESMGFNAKRVVDNGEFLTEEARKNLKATIEQKYKVSEKSYVNLYKEYGRRIDGLTGKPGTGTTFISDYRKAFDVALTPLTKSYNDISELIAENPTYSDTVERMIDDGLDEATILESLSEQSFSSVGGDTNKAMAKVSAIPEGKKAGQCGRFVNSLTGLGLGDSYQSKISKMNPSIKAPKPGMVFVMPLKNTGHTGIILSVKNGIATVKDSNWGLDEKVQVHNIPVSRMTGFNYA